MWVSWDVGSKPTGRMNGGRCSMICLSFGNIALGSPFLSTYSSLRLPHPTTEPGRNRHIQTVKPQASQVAPMSRHFSVRPDSLLVRHQWRNRTYSFCLGKSMKGISFGLGGWMRGSKVTHQSPIQSAGLFA